MMSEDKVARTISELYGLSPSEAKRIANAAVHRRRASSEYCGLAPVNDGSSPAVQDETAGIPLETLALEIRAVSAIALSDAFIIAGRVAARVASLPHRHSLK
jgi:hypothetical protein